MVPLFSAPLACLRERHWVAGGADGTTRPEESRGRHGPAGSPPAPPSEGAALFLPKFLFIPFSILDAVHFFSLSINL